jgi:very-short-patch-repair endonuclease
MARRGKVPSAGNLIVRREVTDLAMLSAIDHGKYGKAAQRGVYPPLGTTSLTPLEGMRAALLSTNQPDAIVSHVLVGIFKGLDIPGEKLDMPTCVTLPRAKRRPERPGLHFHTCRMPDEDIERPDKGDKDLAITKVHRVLVDFARDPDWTVEQVAHTTEDALRRGLVEKVDIENCLFRLKGIPHVKRARTILGACMGKTQSPAEIQALLAFNEAQLPEPVPQLEIALPDSLRSSPQFCSQLASGKPLPAKIYADFAWPEHHVIVEIDGDVDHTDPYDTDYDRRRELALRKLRWFVVRVTAKEIRRNPAKVASKIRGVLDRQFTCRKAQ